MELIGFANNRSPYREVSASHLVDFSQSDPNCAARCSTAINPMLCRVPTYSGPGFPRPATRRIWAVSVSPGGIGFRIERRNRRSTRITNGYFLASFSLAGEAAAFAAPAGAAAAAAVPYALFSL